MIGIYGGSSGERGEATRLLMTYNGLSLNNPSDNLTGDLGPDTYEINTAAGSTALDYLSELNQRRDGLEVYQTFKVSRMVRIQGVIRAPTNEKLFDKIKALANAFDPALIWHDNQTDPFLAFDFSSPTTDTANYATGLVPARYYALPLRIPDPVIDDYQGTTALLDITLLMRDPRRYSQTLTTSASGNVVITNSLGDYISPATLNITMSGSGSASFTCSNTTAKHGTLTLTLDLSGLVNTDAVVVDMERRIITVNGTSTPQRYISGDYFHIDVGSNTIAYTNTSNTSSRTISYRRAWSI